MEPREGEMKNDDHERIEFEIILWYMFSDNEKIKEDEDGCSFAFNFLV